MYTHHRRVDLRLLRLLTASEMSTINTKLFTRRCYCEHDYPAAHRLTSDVLDRLCNTYPFILLRLVFEFNMKFILWNTLLYQIPRGIVVMNFLWDVNNDNLLRRSDEPLCLQCAVNAKVVWLLRNADGLRTWEYPPVNTNWRANRRQQSSPWRHRQFYSQRSIALI